MSTKVSPLGLRLFMEGVEVPIISAVVNVQPDCPATASIQIVPTDMSLYFLPRTLVHVFYLDSSPSDEELAEAKKTLDRTAPPLTFDSVEKNLMDRYDLSAFSYKLLFAGEVIGFNYKKTPVGRQQVLQCIDLSSYWDTCYQFFSDFSAGGNGLTDKHHQFVGAGEGIFDNLGGHGWVISNLLNSKPRSPEYQGCSGLQGGLIHLLEVVGGLKYRSKDFKGYKGINDFFTIAELRYGLLSMLGAIQADKTSAKLFAGKAFTAWIQNGMTSIGSLVSFRDMLNFVNRYIFHNIYPNPCAKYVPGGSKAKRVPVKVGTVPFLDSPKGPAIRDGLKDVLDLLLSAAHDEWNNQSVAVGRSALIEANVGLSNAINWVDTVKSSNGKQVGASLREVKSKVKSALELLPIPITPLRGDDLTKAVKAAKLSLGAHNDLYKILNLHVAKVEIKEIQVPGSSFLYNQLFLPEVFFVSPPRCNVIFPDQYNDLNFSRNYMREVTRLASQGGLGMLGGGAQGSQLFTRSYLAPNIKDTRGRLLSATFSQGARILLPHEVHSGIIPKFEWVTDGHRWGIKAACNVGTLKEVTQLQKINYLQRLANFQFFLHRWSARQLAISGVFNPNIVAGFPAVIIDRSAPSPAVLEHLEKMMGRRMLPTQFIGKIHSYSHAISQTGGATSIQFIHARTHRGLDDEFMGILNKEIPEEFNPVTFVVKPKEQASFLDPSGETGHSFTGFLLRNTLVRMWVQKKLKAGIYIPKLGKVKSVKISGSDALSEEEASLIGISRTEFDQYKKVVNQEEVVLATNPNQSVAADAIPVPGTITIVYVQERGTGKYTRSDLAFEDIVRPGWVSAEVWHNKKITEAVYGPLLGVMAITDDNSLGQEQQDEMLNRWKVDQVARTVTDDTGRGGVATVESSSDSKFRYSVVTGSIEETIDGLSLVYGLIKEKGGNLHDFIQDYTRRPVASMIDVLGSQNLDFTEDGHVLDPNTMIEGFHSRAFGDYNTDVQLAEKEGGATTAGFKALHALMEGADAAKEARPGLIGKDDKATTLRPELDPRGRARGRVRAYVEELQISRGLLGS
jgi:hypothetical protein